MRRILAITALAILLLLPASGLCVSLQQLPPKQSAVIIPGQQQPPPALQSCDKAILLNEMGNKFTQVVDIQNALTNYKTNSVSGHYEVCFKGALSLKDVQLGPNFNGTFSVNIASTESKDIHVVGLNLARDNSLNDKAKGEFIKIVHNGTGTLYLEGIQLSNVLDGIVIDGTGKVVIGTYSGTPPIKTVITGDAQKSGSCITVKSPSATLDGVTAKNCAEGVNIQADKVSIINESEISNNKIGVHVHDSFEGTDIQDSRIYANGDVNLQSRTNGVKIDAGIPQAPAFWDTKGGKPAEVPDSEDVYDFEDRPAYLQVQIPDNETRPATIELFISENKSNCTNYSFKQACDVIKVQNGGQTKYLRTQIDPATLRQGPIKINIPDEAFNDTKSFVAMYSDPELGTAGISRQFIKKFGWIAIVATPYDIPTTSGVSDSSGAGSVVDDDSSGTDNTDSGAAAMSGADSVAVAANPENVTAMAGGAGAPAAKACTLIVDQSRINTANLDLWWLIFSLALLATLRPAAVRVRRKK